MGVQIDRAQIANGDFVGAGVERDFGAKIRRMDDAGVILRRADVARILESEPRMPGFEKHRQHPPPQIDRAHRFGADLARARARLATLVGGLESAPAFVVQIGNLVGRKQRPFGGGGDALHKQVGNPVGGVGVVGAAALVAGVFAQFEKLLDVEVPSFEIHATGAFALAALIDGDCGVVHDFQKRNDALRAPVRAFDARAHRPHRSPIVAEPAGEFGEQRVFAVGLEDVGQIVADRREIATRQLRMQAAGIEKRRRGAHKIERRQQTIKLDRARGRVVFVEGEPHRHPHKETLRQFEPPPVGGRAQKIAVVKRLQAEIAESEIALGIDGRAEFFAVEFFAHIGVQQFGVDARAQHLRQMARIQLRHLRRRNIGPQRFALEFGEQQARGDKRIIRLALDERARGENRRLAHVVFARAIEQFLHRGAQDGFGVDGFDSVASGFDAAAQIQNLERAATAVGGDDIEFAAQQFARRLAARFGARLAVKNVRARDFVAAAAHERQFDLVLDIFDMKHARQRIAAREPGDDGGGGVVDDFAHARRAGGGGAFDGEKRFHHRGGDFLQIKRHRGAGTTHDAIMRKLRRRRGRDILDDRRLDGGIGAMIGAIFGGGVDA